METSRCIDQMRQSRTLTRHVNCGEPARVTYVAFPMENAMSRVCERFFSPLSEQFILSMLKFFRWSNKYVVLDCPTDMAKDIVVSHVRDIALGKRTYHYLLSGLVSCEIKFFVVNNFSNSHYPNKIFRIKNDRLHRIISLNNPMYTLMFRIYKNNIIHGDISNKKFFFYILHITQL